MSHIHPPLRQYFLILTLAFWATACQPTAAPTPAPTTEPTALATAVPTPLPTATPTPLPTAVPTAVPTATPSPTPLPTLPPTPTTSAGLGGTLLTEANIRLWLPSELGTELFMTASAEDVPYTTLALQPTGYCRDVGCITVYNLAYYRDSVMSGDYNVEQLQIALETGATDFFPTVGAAILLRSQTQFLEFEGGRGLRALVMRGQDGYFANNSTLVYDFQGLSADGRYYIEVLIPLDATILPDTADIAANTNPLAQLPTLPADTEPYSEAWFTALRTYNADMAIALETLPNDQFSPNLALLDALVQSLYIGE